MSHASVSNYVETRLDGEWGVYIEKLEKTKNSLEDIQKRGKGAVLKLNGKRVTLRGKNLGNYILLSGDRLEIVRCLADQASMAGLHSVTTAEGGDTLEAKDDSEDQVECGLIPKVTWWKLKTPESIIDYVSRKHLGDWQPYITTWSQRLIKIQGMHDKGQTLVTKSGIALWGFKLRNYVEKTRKRLSVIRCLATANPETKA